jgi:glucokinase
MTNRDGWPDFVLSSFNELTGCGGSLHNDAEVLAADAINTDPSHLTVVRAGHVWREGRGLMLTVSTGVGPALFENGRTTATELGHMGAQPLTDLERSFTDFTARKLGVPFVKVEHVISGHHGFTMAVHWARSLGFQPNNSTQILLDELYANGEDYGPAIGPQTNVDPFAALIMRVIGGLHGTYLRELMATLQPTAGVHLVGGVNRDIATFADPTVSPLLERIADRRLPHADQVDKFAIFHNTDPQLAERGAKVLALAS